MDKGNVMYGMTPDLTINAFYKDSNGENFDESFLYWSDKALEKSPSPDISFSVNQCAYFSSNP